MRTRNTRSFRSRNQRFNVTYNIIFMSKIQNCDVQFQNNDLVKHQNIRGRNYLLIANYKRKTVTKTSQK